MKKKILIIGYGSAGRKHANILKDNKSHRIYLFTKQKVKNYFCIKNLNDIKIINPDYIIISSVTSKHIKHLKFIDKTLKHKLILIEKPLFEKYKDYKLKNNKQVFIGYNLRHNILLNYLKKFILNKKVFSVKINCLSYLPRWRKNIKYEKSNSAKKKYGGGALLELSHELDYLQWIFGKIKKIKFSSLRKISNLKIDCEDNAVIFGEIKKISFLINLNIASLIEERSITIDCENFCIKANLLKNNLEIIEDFKGKKKLNFPNIDTYKAQHQHMLNRNFKKLCSYTDGMNIMKIIEKIKKFK